MICIPISAETNDGMLALIARAEKEPAEMYEFRFDCLEEKPEVEKLLAAASRPVMATCRSVNEGGSYRGGFADRRSILRRAGMAGAAYIDSEASDLVSLDDCVDSVRVISMHDFDRTPPDLDYRISALSATSADWVKFAVTARGYADNLKLFKALEKCRKPAIAIAMGELGVISRILGMRAGSRVAFGSLGAGLESAPGQPTAAELANLYRVHSITADTEVHGFLGHPDDDALRHLEYNRAFVREGLDAVCIPFLSRDAADFLNSIPNGLGLRRVAVSPRYAVEALAWAEDASPAARRSGRADTLNNVNGHWIADVAESPRSSESVIVRSVRRYRQACWSV